MGGGRELTEVLGGMSTMRDTRTMSREDENEAERDYKLGSEHRVLILR